MKLLTHKNPLNDNNNTKKTYKGKSCVYTTIKLKSLLNVHCLSYTHVCTHTHMYTHTCTDTYQ